MLRIRREAWFFCRSQNMVDSTGPGLESRTQGILRNSELRLFRTGEVLQFVADLIVTKNEHN